MKLKGTLFKLLGVVCFLFFFEKILCVQNPGDS